MVRNISGGLFVDKIPYGHRSSGYWGEPDKKVETAAVAVEDTPNLTDKFEGKDPLEGLDIQGTQFHIPNDLFEHQKEDVRQILRSDKNFLVLSEMGVGKTPEAITVAMAIKAKNVLVLLPKSLRLEWKRQIEQWTGVTPVICHRGSSRRINPLFEEKYEPERQGKKVSPFFVLNYDSFRLERITEIINQFPWDMVIMDEVHHCRNAETKTTRGLLKFFQENKKAKVLMMSGSPIVNNPLDIYTMLMMQNSDRYNRKNRFEFLNTYAYWTPYRSKPKIFGTKNEDQFRREIAPFTIRRKKEEVLKYLPDKYTRVATLEMDEEQREVYDKMASELVVMLDDGEEFNAPGVLALLTRLRQLNLDPRLIGLSRPSSKTEFLLEMVDDFAESGEGGTPRKLVVFSTFAMYVELIGKELDKMGISHVDFTGKTHADKIGEQVKAFQEDPSIQVALGTIKVMGEGITLTAASDVVLMDRWWTPAANNQAIDRLHRPGQENAVQVILPTNERSIDQTLDEILNAKQQMMDSLLQEGSIMEEFMESFRRSHAFIGLDNL